MYRVFCIASFVITIALSSLPAQSDGSSKIYNAYTNQCLQPADLSEAVVQQPCTSAFAQGWYAYSAGGNNIVGYQNAWNAMCPRSGCEWNPRPAVAIRQHQQSELATRKTRQGRFPLISRVSGTRNYCLDIPGGSRPPGSRCRFTSAMGPRVKNGGSLTASTAHYRQRESSTMRRAQKRIKAGWELVLAAASGGADDHLVSSAQSRLVADHGVRWSAPRQPRGGPGANECAGLLIRARNVALQPVLQKHHQADGQAGAAGAKLFLQADHLGHERQSRFCDRVCPTG
jgi:hypothetical protein